MSEGNLLIRMAENDAWANQRLYRAARTLSAEEFTRSDRTSFFPSIALTLEHLLLVERFYLDALEEGPVGYAVFDLEGTFLDAETLWRAQAAEDARLLALVRGLRPEDLDRRVLCRWKTPAREAVRQVLVHLLTHQIHHRGQVHAMLAGTVVKPPQLDEFFLDVDREGRREEAIAAGVTP